jgi:hypothetical protein
MRSRTLGRPHCPGLHGSRQGRYASLRDRPTACPGPHRSSPVLGAYPSDAQDHESAKRSLHGFRGLPAYDHPGRWQGVTADVLFQRLAQYVEAVEEHGEPMDWRGVAEAMIAWRASEGEG